MNKATPVKRVDMTRWSAKERAVNAALTTYDFVLESLLFIEINGSSIADVQAKQLLNSIEEFEYNFMLRVLFEIFERTEILSKALQSSGLELDRCSLLVKVALESLAELLNENEFKSTYNKALDFAKERDLKLPSLPRQSKVPIRFKDSESNLTQTPIFSSPEEMYRAAYYEAINTAISEIDFRFNKKSLSPFLLMEKIIKGSEDQLQELIDLNYYDHLIDLEALKQELLTWKIVLKTFSNENKTDLTTIDSITKLIIDNGIYF